MEQADLGIIGVSHKTSNLEARESLADDYLILNCLNQAETEHAIINTCNRTEVIYASPSSRFEKTTQQILDNVFNKNTKSFSYYKYKNIDAITHFYKVTSGLDSMVLGEAEIFGQIKKSYFQAVKNGSVQSNLHRLFQSAFRTAKQVRTSTGVGRGRVSVASTSIEASLSVFGSLSNLKVLLVGAGETAELMSHHFLKQGVSQFYVSNRTEQNSKKIVDFTNGVFIPLDKIYMVMPLVDIVAVAISARDKGYLIEQNAYKNFISSQPRKTYCFLDLSVPRAVDPKVSELGSTYLFNIDSIEQIAKKNLDNRLLEAQRAEEIINFHVEEFENWKKNRINNEYLKKLFTYYKDISRSELERSISLEIVTDLLVNDKLDKVVSSMAKKFYLPVLNALKSGKMSEHDLRKLIEQLTV